MSKWQTEDGWIVKTNAAEEEDILKVHACTYSTPEQALKAAASLLRKFPFYETRIVWLPVPRRSWRLHYRKAVA